MLPSSLNWLFHVEPRSPPPLYWLAPKPPGDWPLVACEPGEKRLCLFVEEAKLIRVSLMASMVWAPGAGPAGLICEYCAYLPTSM